jgi:hypothetical protein
MPIPKLKITENQNYSDIDYSQLSSDLSIYVDKHYDKPPTCIEIWQHGEKHRFGTLGNFSVIGGKGKSRKTFFISALIGAALGGNKILNICSDFNKKRIVFFDTEQSEYDLYWAARRAVLLNQITYHPTNYDVFCLRPLSPIERVAFIENYLEQTMNVGYIVIDGIRDLLTDINSPEQATEITTKLMQWTKVYDIHASVVLHENPGSDKLRGHLGTEVQNKAETVISIEKPTDNPTVSRVIPKFIRGSKEFDEFAFTINENALPELTNYEIDF